MTDKKIKVFDSRQTDSGLFIVKKNPEKTPSFEMT